MPPNSSAPNSIQRMVPMAGIGPATSPLPRECSTTEPHGRLAFKPLSLGAGDEVRTRDILLGRQVLYQLSYTRATVALATYIPLKPTPTGS